MFQVIVPQLEVYVASLVDLPYLREWLGLAVNRVTVQVRVGFVPYELGDDTRRHDAASVALLNGVDDELVRAGFNECERVSSPVDYIERLAYWSA